MDTLSKEERSRNMSAIRARDTGPEMKVRRMLHSLGYRYTLHKNDLPGRPDIFMRKYNTVIFVHGCFWHQHSNCKYATKPKSNKGFWLPKLKRNIRRDKENIRRLKKKGYNVIVLWECEIEKKDEWRYASKKLIQKLKALKN